MFWHTIAIVVLASCGVAAGQSTTRPNLPLKVSENGRYLVDQKGSPFLVVGDSPWSLIVQLDGNATRQYLQDRQRKGFNSIIVNLIEHKFSSKPPATRAGLTPFSTPADFSTPNDAYFDWAASVVKQAGQHGIVVWLAPAYLGYGGGDEGFFREIKAGGRGKLRAYGRYVGKRFKDLPNLVWIAGGDYTPDKDDQWTVTELAEGLREADPDHPMTAHPARGTSAAQAFGDPNWLNVNPVYTYDKALSVRLLEEYQRKPVRPFVLLEAIYEGEHDSTPEQVRRQAWWAMLGGTCGQFFGNNPIWHFDGPGLFPAKMTWQEALDSHGSREMTILRDFFANLPWHQLAPEANHAVVADGYGKDLSAVLAAHTANLTVEGNLFFNSGQGFMLEETDGGVFRNNMVVGTHHSGMILGHGNSHNWTVAQNTFAFTAYKAFTYSGKGTVLRNNVILAGGDNMIVIQEGKEPLVSDYNLYWKANGSSRIQVGQGQDAHSKVGDPKFRSAPALGRLAVYYIDVWSDKEAAAKSGVGKLCLGGRPLTDSFKVGDHIEVNFDGRLRKVTEVTESIVAFDPPLAAMHKHPWETVVNWKDRTEAAWDCRLADDSPGKKMGDKGQDVGSSINMPAYTKGDFNGDGKRDLPDLPKD